MRRLTCVSIAAVITAAATLVMLPTPALAAAGLTVTIAPSVLPDDGVSTSAVTVTVTPAAVANVSLSLSGAKAPAASCRRPAPPRLRAPGRGL